MINRNLIIRLGEEKIGEKKDITELRKQARYIIDRFTNESYISKYKDIISEWMKEDFLPDLTAWDNSNVTWQVLKWGTEEEFEFILSKVLSNITVPETSDDKTKLSLMAGSIRGKERIKKLLKLVLFDDNTTYSDKALKLILGQCWGHRDGNVGLFEIVSENWDELKQRYENHTEIWKEVFKNALNFKTQDGLNQVVEFYDQKNGQFGSAENKVKDVIEEVERLAGWSNKNLPVMEAWLSKKLAET